MKPSQSSPLKKLNDGAVKQVLMKLYDKNFSFDELVEASREVGDALMSPIILRRYATPVMREGPSWAWKYTLTSEAKMEANPDDLFSDIEGHDDKKLIIKNFIKAPGNVNLLLLGWYGTGKSLFIRDIHEKFPSVYVEGANSTPVGMLEQIREKIQETGSTRIFLLIDELDKMIIQSDDPDKKFKNQNGLSNVIDVGARLNKTKFDLQGTGAMSYDIKLEGFKTIATANSLKNISPLLLQRFGNYIEFKPYTKAEFYRIAVRLLVTRYNKPQDLASKIAKYLTESSSDTNIREVDKLGEIIHNEDELDAYKRITRVL
ncbi:MAG: AAA family ATPase [Thermoplasmata archaeon]